MGILVACGGRSHSGRVEADELARLLTEAGVPREAILCERMSQNTRENADYAAKILLSRGVEDVVVVTCSWHLPRATKLFERTGLRVQGIGAEPPDPGVLERLWWAARERVSTWKDLRRTRVLWP
jgi:uncharacterized SAM-binding protein YcdF (DUF218 family)